MRVREKNALTRDALGIASIEFVYYRAGQAHWRVMLRDGEKLKFATHNLATESTVLRLAAEKLSKMGKPVNWPKGAEMP